MRLAFLLEQLLAPVPGGTGRYAGELAGALAATAPPTGRVDGWTAWHRDTRPAAVHGVGGPRRLPLPRRPLIAAWERGLGPAPGDAEVVHAPTLLAPPRRRLPLVVTIHDTVPWTHPETLTPRGVGWHRRMADRVARSADLVVVPTAAVAAGLAERLPLADRLRVVGAGVTPALLAPPPDADDRAARLGLPTGGFLLSLATLEPRKGLDVALAALAHPAAPHLPLVVAGPAGWGGVDPYAAAAAVGLPPDRLRVVGKVADADLAVLVHRAVALLAPSRAEGFGLPVLEAMAAGTPVITSADPALVEVGGGATVVVPTADPAALAEALAGLVSDPAWRQRLAAAGQTRAAQYSWPTVARQLWAAYAELAS